MLKIDSKAFEEIRLWMYRNARPLELAIWQYEFENGNSEAVLSALAAYKNPDGGFGNALEPDNWNPNSSPYTTRYAINILKDINFTEINYEIMRGIFRFLESGVFCEENGWLFSIPSNDDYPHAPWWTYNAEANDYESIGVTAELSSFILKLAYEGSELYKRAFNFAQKQIARLEAPGNYGEMGIGGCCELAKMIRDLDMSDKFNMELLNKSLKKLVYDSIERDTSKWVYYGKRPSSYIISPDSEFYADNEEIMQKELDYLISTRPENGVWGITWSWFENNEKYAKEFAISENWWRGINAISNLKLLRNFGRLNI